LLRGSGKLAAGDSPPTSSPSQAPSSTGWLTYQGGPVIGSVKIIPVFFRDSLNLSLVTQNMDEIVQYYRMIVNSTFMTALSEYNVGGTMIGKGVVTKRRHVKFRYEFNEVVQTSRIHHKLSEYFDQGLLPAPQENVDEVYALHFPPGMIIQDSADKSKSANAVDGNWCGIHGSFKYQSAALNGNRTEVYFMILPDFNDLAKSGCASLNGNDGLFSTISHEIAETVTDPQVGIFNRGDMDQSSGQRKGKISWYGNSGGGEIGDWCNGQLYYLNMYNARSGSMEPRAVQAQWSNQLNSCVKVTEDGALIPTGVTWAPTVSPVNRV